jgi:hypothetical protein
MLRGLVPTLAKRGQHWTHATLIAEIRRIHRAGARRFFGSWDRARAAAGV